MAALREGARDPMSKAFVESDREADLPYEPPAIPAGIKNYMTPQGHRHMQPKAVPRRAREGLQSANCVEKRRGERSIISHRDG
jgi:hypothetical protein